MLLTHGIPDALVESADDDDDDEEEEAVFIRGVGRGEGGGCLC